MIVGFVYRPNNTVVKCRQNMTHILCVTLGKSFHFLSFLICKMETVVFLLFYRIVRIKLKHVYKGLRTVSEAPLLGSK